MKPRVRILCLILSAILTMSIGMSVIAAENTASSTDIMTSDLFYGYSYYLYPQLVDGTEEQWVTDRYLNSAIGTAEEAMLNAASGAGDIISAAIYSFSNGDYLFSEFMAQLGLEDSLNEKCVDKATRLLLVASLQDEEFVSGLVQGSEDFTDSWEMIKDGADLLGEGGLLDDSKLAGIQSALEAKDAVFDAVDQVITAAEMGSYICFVEAVNDEVLDYLIETIEKEELKESLVQHKTYKTNNYVDYITETYLTETIVSGVADAFKDAIGWSGVETYTTIANFIFKVCATITSEISGLGSTEEILVATKLYDYITSLQTEKSELLGHFENAPVLPEDVKKYEFCYNMYIAAAKAYVSATKEVYADYEEKLDKALEQINENVSYENHLADCKAVANSIPEQERRLTVNTTDELYYKLEDLTYISTPSNTMEENTIYLCNDKLYYGIEAYADVYFKTSDETVYCTIDGDFMARSSTIYIPENIHVTLSEDYLGTYLDLWDEKNINIYGTLIVNGTFTDEYLSKTHVNLLGDSSTLQLNGDVSIKGTWTVTEGDVSFTGSNISADGLGAIGENASIKLQGADIQSLCFSAFTLERVSGYTDEADITIAGGADAGYVLSGNGEGYVIESTRVLYILDELNVYGLAVEESTLDVTGTLNVREASFQDAIVNIYGTMDVADAFIGAYLDLRTYNSVNVYGTLVINGSFEDESLASTTLVPVNGGSVIFQGTGTGTIAPSMFTLERKSGYSPNLTLMANDSGFFIQKTDASTDACATAFHIRNSLVLDGGSYAFDNTYIESTGTLVLDENVVVQGNLYNTGTLQMTTGKNLCVEGDFTVDSVIDHTELLTAGVLEVKEDFTQNGTMYKNYNTSGTHITLLSGMAAQNVKFYYYQGNTLKHLEITNTSALGVIFKSHITMEGLFEHNQKAFTLYSEGSRSTFRDYDGDGVSDEADPYPGDAEVSEYLLTADEIPRQVYTGTNLEPAVVVRDGAGKERTVGTDYTITYSNNTEQGTATAKITGLGKYTGKSLTLNFEIACSHSYGEWVSGEENHTRQCTICLETETAPHSLEWVIDLEATEAATGLKHQKCTECSYECDENTMIEKLPHTHVMKAMKMKEASCTTEGSITHYQCTSCSKLYRDSMGEIELEAKDIILPKLGHNYVSATTRATISKNGKTVTKCKVCGNQKSATTICYPKTIKLATTSYTYNGKVRKPAIKVTDSAGKKISSEYYTVTYASGCKNVGKYKVTIKFKGLYSGTKTLYFTIEPNAKLALNKTTFVYNDKVQKPTTVVKTIAGKKLGTQYYKVSYSGGRKNVGIYTVTVKLKNGYNGTLK